VKTLGPEPKRLVGGLKLLRREPKCFSKEPKRFSKRPKRFFPEEDGFSNEPKRIVRGPKYFSKKPKFFALSTNKCLVILVGPHPLYEGKNGKKRAVEWTGPDKNDKAASVITQREFCSFFLAGCLT